MRLNSTPGIPISQHVDFTRKNYRHTSPSTPMVLRAAYDRCFACTGQARKVGLAHNQLTKNDTKQEDI
jgi:hypothetical protein